MVPANKIGEGWGATEGATAYSIYRIYFTFSAAVLLVMVLPRQALKPSSPGSPGLCYLSSYLFLSPLFPLRREQLPPNTIYEAVSATTVTEGQMDWRDGRS